VTAGGGSGTGVSDADVGVGVASSLGGVMVGGSTFFLPSQLLRRLIRRLRNISLTCLRHVCIRVLGGVH
jgi:hypothetical protein